jgi:hypothetical protein
MSVVRAETNYKQEVRSNLKYILQSLSGTDSVKGRNLPNCMGFEGISLEVVYIDC